MLTSTDKPILSLDAFEGPLDLLLQLIEQQRLDITKIALAQVAEQYLVTVHAAPNPDPAMLAEFLTIGGRLLVIKTRALLPRSPLEELRHPEEDLGEQLARQLREYSRFKAIAATLREREEAGLRTYLRIASPPVPPRPTPERNLSLDIGIDALHAAVERRLALLRSEESAPTAVPQTKVLTIAEVTAHLRARLRASTWVTFDDLLSVAVTRTEVIVTLWTVLELFKRRVITFEQDQVFDLITLGRGPAFDTVPVSDEI